MGSHLFLQLAAILALAAGLGIVARRLRQPLIIAYIFAGLVISFFGLFKGLNQDIYNILSNFGIAFLLFLVGIELKIEDLKFIGKAAIYTGLGQIVFTAFIGFIILSGFGYTAISSLYIAIAITFSSTVIIVKLLSEKNDLRSLYGKIAVGFLLIQDFVAILALMFLSGFGPGRIPTAGGIFLILFITSLLMFSLK